MPKGFSSEEQELLDNNKCPNGCGEFETASGRIDLDSEGYLKVTVLYCKECGFIYTSDASW